MKKFTLFLLSLLFLFLAGYGLLRSELAKSFLKSRLESALANSDLQVTIGRIDGSLPHKIAIRHIAIEGKGIHATIDEVSLRPILWRLLYKELAFKDVEAKNVFVEGAGPFSFQGKVRFSKSQAVINGQIDQYKVYAKFLPDSASFSVRYQKFRARGKFDYHGPFYVIVNQPLGKIVARGQIGQQEARYKWKWPELGIKGTGEAKWAQNHLTASINAEGQGALTLDVKMENRSPVGLAELHLDNLGALQIPHIFGKLDAKATFQTDTLHLDMTAHDVFYDTFFASKVSCYSDLSPSLQLLDIEIEKAKWRELSLDLASIEIKDQTFSLFAEGNWKHPLEFHMSGTFEPWKAHVENMNGIFYNHSFVADKPFDVAPYFVSDLALSVGSSSALFKLDHDAMELRLHQMPLDLLSLNPLDVPISGQLDLVAQIDKEKGDLVASIEQMTVGLLPEASAHFTGHFLKNRLNLTGDILVKEKPLLSLEAAIPMQMDPIMPLLHKPAHGSITLDGRVEDLLDFLDLGPHRFEGFCKGNFQFRNTLYRPFVQGSFSITDGRYENYYSGTILQNIQAECTAEQSKIFLRSFTANNDLLKATGQIDLLYKDHFPFFATITFHDLPLAQIDLVQASASGQVHIEGNALSALVRGDVEVIDATLHIPDHIPSPPPILHVTYRNQIHPAPLPDLNYKPYPLLLDLNVTTPSPISIDGRGLESNWNGSFHIGGSYTDLAAKGDLKLIDGAFHFSSRTFELMEGSLSFSGAAHAFPHLNLAASIEMKGVTIIARLHGPLNNPQITLQSSPPLPLSSIISYLLFGQDVKDLSGFEALQVATSIATLAGVGPDVMESTRKAIGVDRLRIISKPNDAGGETVSLEVGKYVTEGVLVTFTQGTEEDSSSVRVEIELRGNFSFQIENDSAQDQGIFTLKWSHNY